MNPAFPQSILAEFHIPPPAEVAPYGNGHIHATWLVTGADGARHILQQMNTRVFPRPLAVIENIRKVTAHLAQRGHPTLTLVPARAGWHAADPAGNVWRAFPFLGGTRTLQRVTQPAEARALGHAFGAFQRALAGFDQPLHETIPRFHDTPFRLSALAGAARADPHCRAASAAAELEFAFARRALARRLLGLQARGHLPTRICHNDTKINNLLLDEAGDGACVIDLDTVMPGLWLYDFGDMVRTGTATAEEDAPDPAAMGVSLALFGALAEGYLAAAGDALSPLERSLLPFAGQLLAFETGVRFLTDYLLGDGYFKTAYPAHNLVRCRAQFALAAALARAEGELLRMVA